MNCVLQSKDIEVNNEKKWNKMNNLMGIGQFKFILSALLYMSMLFEAEASTGNLRGACWDVAKEKFPGSELVGMLGGNMSDFNVTGYLIDSKGVPQKIFCYFPYSHGKPKDFRSDVFASDKKDPVKFTREHVKKLKERARESVKTRSRMQEELLRDLEAQ